MKDRAQRVLIIAAYPEDEAAVFGATIASLVQRGTELIVLTCSNSPKNDEAHAAVRDILGITAHHVLREDDGAQFTTRTARDLAADLVAAITSLKPDVVVSYASNASGSNYEQQARLVSEATAHATELAGIPFYTTSSTPVDRGVAVTSPTATAFKRQAMEIYSTLPPVGESVATPVEYLRRLRRRELVIGERNRFERIVLAIVATAVGALVGLVLTAVHQSAITLWGVRVPWGIIAAVALTTALILGLRLIYDTRVAPGFASLGVLAMSALLATAMPGGTILIPGNVSGYVWTFAPVLIILVVVGWPRVNRQASTSSRDNIELNSPVKGADIS
ncbi:PIG-L family deacetylase [Salinibacterium sp. PAMC 21357]|uniref:PIG-L family deacetylase n=1 Tax=Salinibacterium sp. PAMC 21357 TaxID=1112215 RepID=UPI000288DB11|nr:PIG-L family deacetylase [Salinibacterium sp. PAMC 21357]